MFEKDLNDFNKFFNLNYLKLVRDAEKIASQHPHIYDIASDLVHDNYLKIRNRIIASGFTGTTIYGYFWRSIQNDFRVLVNRDKIRTFVELDTTVHNDNQWQKGKSDRSKAEEYLLNEEQWNAEQEKYYRIVETIVVHLFNYVQNKYNEKQSYLFITYFINGDTYQQLSERTGVNIRFISQTIKPIKRDLKNNFENYLRQQYDRLY